MPVVGEHARPEHGDQRRVPAAETLASEADIDVRAAIP